MECGSHGYFLPRIVVVRRDPVNVVSLTTLLRRTVAVATVVAPVFAAHLLVARPYQLRWGATNAEVARAMPGDALSSRPTFLSTRAITIDVTPEVIWPWLVQIGYGRAGFYGNDTIENLGSPRAFAALTAFCRNCSRLPWVIRFRSARRES